jgi:DNA polymerase-1
MSIKERLGLRKDPIFLVDGTAYVYKAYYAFPDLKRSDGFPTNALFIVLRVLMRLMREESPAYLGFFLDGKGPTFRHEIYEPYKAQREATPEPLVQQLEPIQNAVRLLGFNVDVSQGVEADDRIASLAARLKTDRPVVIVAADKDLKQCLDENVYLWDPTSKQDVVHTLDSFREDSGLEPDQWPDYQALIGDSSDNIPGVPGVGPKTAQKILDRLPTLEQIRDHLDELKPAERKKVEPHMDDVFVYRKLTGLRLDVADESLQDFKRTPMDPAALADFLQTYEFRSLARELQELLKERGAASASGKQAQEQLSLLTAAAPSAQAPKAEAITRPDDLPSFEDKEVGLAPGDKGYRLGLEGRELHYTGRPEALARVLAGVAAAFHPDVKQMIKKGGPWEELDLAQWFDLGLAAYLLNPEERDYSWPKLSQRFANELDISPEAPGLLALEAGHELRGQLERAHLFELMHDVEMPLIPVLASMEKAGIRIDTAAFQEFLNEVSRELQRLTARIHKVAGGPFNLRSSQQLAQVLFDTLGLKPAGKTAGGQPSTSQAVLEKLAGQHEVIDDILEYRKLEKLRSTYLEPLPKLVAEDGRIHTTFNQLATATGRLSSSNPNMQNIPIRGPLGGRMRSCFTAEPGNLLVAADYSQIELRVLAHLSQDPTLVQAFNKGEDIHARTAGLLFDKEPGDITPDERRGAKTINFGLIYGMGPQKLAQDLRISLKEAKAFIERYFERLHVLRDFFDQVQEHARTHGYVTTMAGRRRLLPEIHSDNAQLQSTAKRQAVNTRIQGSAADIIKLAMRIAHNDETLQSLGARLILQVHDELVMEAPQDNADQAGRRLAELMAGATPGGEPLSVPLDVDWGTGKTWADAH